MSDPEHDAAPDDIDAVRDELRRLRALVGPSEQSYDDLRRELLAASDAVRGAQAEVGNLKGTIAELEVALVRAQQDQDHFQRIVYDTLRSGRRRMGRAIRSRVL